MHIITLSAHLYIIVHVYFNRFVWYMAFRENFVGMPVFPSVTHHILRDGDREGICSDIVNFTGFKGFFWV